jgi:3',5'-cyclic AMP phosphodiesterase CpdA
MKTRRIFLSLVSAVLMFSFTACSLSVSAPEAGRIESGKDISFFITTDIHYLAKSLTDGGEAYQKFINSGDGRQLNYIDELMDAFTNDIKKKKPQVLIISGDLTTNGERESHLELSKKLNKIEEMGTSVYVIPGNHDILNPYARSFKGADQYLADYINEKDFSKIYGDFGYNEAISKDENTLSYLAAPSKDIWLLMLDTSHYKNNLTLGHHQLEGSINTDTFKWIKKCSYLAKKNHAQIITVMHHNLLDHSELVSKGYTLDNNKEALELFRNEGIPLTLTGHIHLQDIKVDKKEASEIHDIATGALGIYPQKYGILKFSPKSGYDYSTSSIDVEGWSRESGIVDKNLNNFKKYSREFFYNNYYSKTYSRLLLWDSYTDDEIKSMAETSAMIRLKYYEGTIKTVKEELMNSKGFKLWKSVEQERYMRNMMNMLNSDSTANNELHLSSYGRTK